MSLISITRTQTTALSSLQFSHPVSHVYNPLEYAWQPHQLYLKKFGVPPKKVILVGMNPGPWGMLQTGVPFGEIHAARDWMGIEAPVGSPVRLHPKRPIMGYACTRSEISGKRLWGWAQKRFVTPERFFERFFVVNYCPLAFFDEAGTNITPDKIRSAERTPLEQLCTAALRDTIKVLSPRFVIGIGAYAETKARSATAGLDVVVGRITHPSPANPKANAGWERVIEQELSALGVLP